VLAGFGAAILVGLGLAVNLRIGLGALVVLVYAPVALLNLAVGALIWIPLAFLERLPPLGLGVTTILIVFAVAWLGALPPRRAIVTRVLREHRGLFALVALTVLWVTLSLLWAVDATIARDTALQWLRVAVIFLLISTSVVSERYAKLACAAFVVGAVLSVVVGLVPGATAAFDTTADEAGRLGGGLGDPNYLAAGLVPALAIATGLIGVTASQPARWALIGAMTTLAAGLVATGSRGGLVAAAVGVVAALLVARGRRLHLGALVVLTVSLIGLWLSTSSPQTWDRIRDFETDTGRQDLWQVAWKMSEDNLVAGVGAGNFETRAATYVREPGQIERADLILDNPHVAHNVYLQQLAETGVIGLALLLGLLGAALRSCWVAALRFDARGDPATAALARALMVAQVSALAASIFLSNGSDTRLWILLALGPALASASGRRVIER